MATVGVHNVVYAMPPKYSASYQAGSRLNICLLFHRYFFDSSSMKNRTTIEQLSENYRRTNEELTKKYSISLLFDSLLVYFDSLVFDPLFTEALALLTKKVLGTIATVINHNLLEHYARGKGTQG